MYGTWYGIVCYGYMALFGVIAEAEVKVPLYGTNYRDPMDQYFIVPKQSKGTLKVAALANMQSTRRPIEQFGNIIGDKYGVHVLRHYEIGQWKAILVRGNHSDIYNIQNNDDVSYMEANTKIKAFVPITEGNQDIQILSYRDITDRTVPQNTNDVPLPGNRNATTTPLYCYEQYPGDLLWHLPRVSSHTEPNYRRASYMFTDIDKGQGVTVYIIDTGIRTSHLEFKGRARFGYKARGLDESNDDLNGHGTHVASLVAGDTVGVAKEANTVAVKVLDQNGIGDLTWIVDGLEWVSNEVAQQKQRGTNSKSVINMSLGANGVSYFLDDVIKSIVKDVGIPVVAAAGNDHADACNSSPARAESVITSAATTPNDVLASFSNYGSCVDILSPGQNVVGAWAYTDSAYASVSGTSQATPIVAGTIARFISSMAAEYSPSPAFIKSYIIDTSTLGTISWTDSVEADTPNRLIYKACEALGPQQGSYRPTYPNNGVLNAASSHRKENVVTMFFSTFFVMYASLI